jgi:hypothetical protein
MARARRMTAAERDAQRTTVVELRSGMPAQVRRPMMNPEDQSHRFVITGQDLEGRSRPLTCGRRHQWGGSGTTTLVCPWKPWRGPPASPSGLFVRGAPDRGSPQLPRCVELPAPDLRLRLLPDLPDRG